MRTKTLLRYLLKRLVAAIVLMFLAASGMLVLMRFTSGDIVSVEFDGQTITQEFRARERARLGLDRPFAEQYATWLSRAVRLDFGTSFRFRQPVTTLVTERARNTAILLIAAIVVGTIIGLPLGVIAGGGRAPVLGWLVRIGSLLALSMPTLLTSIVFAWIAARTGWFPIGGVTSVGAAELSFAARASDFAWHLVLPAISLALPLVATLERLQADAVATVRMEPFVLGALARGVPGGRVIWRDVWRPALGPVLAIYGLSASYLLSGSFPVELVTGWPGLGRLMFDALNTRDVPLAAGCAAAAALVLSVWSTVAEMVLAALDPRTRAAIGEPSA